MYQMTTIDRAAATMSQGATRLRQLFTAGNSRKTSDSAKATWISRSDCVSTVRGRGVEVEDRHGDGDEGEDLAPPAHEVVDAAFFLLDELLDLALFLVAQQFGLDRHRSSHPK